ncbi:hypothetical protein [Polaromonas naphthalenivorans]|nr:hypothetical protein [Polaromonas naphthalenivorans]
MRSSIRAMASSDMAQAWRAAALPSCCSKSNGGSGGSRSTLAS